MNMRIYSGKILISIALYCYQSIWDLNKDFLLKQYLYIEDQFIPASLHLTIAKQPAIFLLIFIIHRAIIHSLIVKFYTGKNEMMRIYMFIDLFLFFLATPIFLIRKMVPELAIITEPFTFAFFKLLNTPLLLLFFIPAYYIISAFPNKANRKHKPENNL